MLNFNSKYPETRAFKGTCYKPNFFFYDQSLLADGGRSNKVKYVYFIELNHIVTTPYRVHLHFVLRELCYYLLCYYFFSLAPPTIYNPILLEKTFSIRRTHTQKMFFSGLTTKIRTPPPKLSSYFFDGINKIS